MFAEPIAVLEVRNPQELLKFHLRRIAKRNPLYFKEVENPYCPEANTVGRILFGIPSFAGLYAQRIKGDKVEVGIEEVRSRLFPEEVIEKVRKLLEESVREFRRERDRGRPPAPGI